MTFGPQKGANAEMLERLEKGMQNYRDVIMHSTGIDADTVQGSGAAGGLGAALYIFLKGRMKPGTETVLLLACFDRALEGADLVITGEGRADASSCFGKTVQGVGTIAKQKGVPVAALCGSGAAGAEKLLEYGIYRILAVSDKDMPLEYAMEHAKELYKKAAVRLFESIRTGLEENKSIPEILREL